MVSPTCAGRAAGAALVCLAVAGCAAPQAAAPELVPSSTRLPAPAAIDPGVRGAGYLDVVAAQLQPRWGAFLEDCRLRLPAGHPLNVAKLEATLDLAIDTTGAIASRTVVAASGNGDFDTAISDVLADASPLPAPPRELLSDDERLHVRWLFARDRRQAGPATARILTVELPLVVVVESLLGKGELAHAARRVAAAPASADRDAASERVMIAALREALASPEGAARRAAVEACGAARIRELDSQVRALLAATADPELRRAAIGAVEALGDRDAAPALLAALHDELVQRSGVALARVAALVALGRGDDAAVVVRSVLEPEPNPTALAALAITPIPALASRLSGWASAGDAAIRRAVCQALPAAAPVMAAGLIARGLGDPDATVRAACADAAGRTAGAAAGQVADPAAGPASDPAAGQASAPLGAPTLQRLHALASDRDRWVRARAVAAIGGVDPTHPARAAADPAPEVRAAFAASASEAELGALARDREPEVRAAALVALSVRGASGPGASGREAAVLAAGDPSAVVRRAAIAALDDVALLARLARDDSPNVATAALVRLTGLSGRAGLTRQLLEQLAAAPEGSIERVRIARAWLLAS